MIDLSDLPNQDYTTTIFYTIGSGIWQTWTKPKGCQFVQMILLGGGGGGSSGYTDAAATITRTGGSGGGSGTVSRGLFPAYTLPNTLFILVGNGGNGQTISTSGSSGETTYVSLKPNVVTPINLILSARGGLCSNSLTAPIGGTAFVSTDGVLSYLGIITSTSGRSGIAGGTNASPVPSLVVIGGITNGGAGGGAIRTSPSDTANNGGGILGSGFVPSISGGLAIGNTNGQSNPYFNLPTKGTILGNPMVFLGGTGGASSITANGGYGGDGSYGSGGGGGGGATTGIGIGGNGGNGGDGLVIITCF
jgi:hypothetical protein